MLNQIELIEKHFGEEYAFSDVIHCYGQPWFREVQDQPAEQMFIFTGSVYENASVGDSDVLIAWKVSNLNHLKCLITAVYNLNIIIVLYSTTCISCSTTTINVR